METQRPKIAMELVDDPEELARAQRRREQFDRNADWLEAHIAEVYEPNRGRFLCVAGQQAFVADTVEEAIEQATAAFPADQGWFTRYIPKHKMARIYAL